MKNDSLIQSDLFRHQKKLVHLDVDKYTFRPEFRAKKSQNRMNSSYNSVPFNPSNSDNQKHNFSISDSKYETKDQFTEKDLNLMVTEQNTNINKSYNKLNSKIDSLFDYIMKQNIRHEQLFNDVKDIKTILAHQSHHIKRFDTLKEEMNIIWTKMIRNQESNPTEEKLDLINRNIEILTNKNKSVMRKMIELENETSQSQLNYTSNHSNNQYTSQKTHNSQESNLTQIQTQLNQITKSIKSLDNIISSNLSYNHSNKHKLNDYMTTLDLTLSKYNEQWGLQSHKLEERVKELTHNITNINKYIREHRSEFDVIKEIVRNHQERFNMKVFNNMHDNIKYINDSLEKYNITFEALNKSIDSVDTGIKDLYEKIDFDYDKINSVTKDQSSSLNAILLENKDMFQKDLNNLVQSLMKISTTLTFRITNVDKMLDRNYKNSEELQIISHSKLDNIDKILKEYMNDTNLKNIDKVVVDRIETFYNRSVSEHLVPIKNETSVLLDYNKTEIQTLNETKSKGEQIYGMLIMKEEADKRNNKEMIKLLTTILSNTNKGDKEQAKEKDRDNKQDNILEIIRKIYNSQISDNNKPGTKK